MRHHLLPVVVGVLFTGLAAAQVRSTQGEASSNSTTREARAHAAFGKLPLYLVENRGVYADEVRYFIQGADKTLFFTDKGVTIALKGEETNWTVKLDFEGANPRVRPEGRDRQPAVFSYFKGPEEDWKAGLPTFSTLVYRDLWPGIDLVYNGTVNRLKYEFVVAPGADPLKIRLRYRGASSVAVAGAGALEVKTPVGDFEDAPPVAYQEIGGRRVDVHAAYALGKDGEFGFDLGDFDRTRPLVLDPAVLVYCGYIGGIGDDRGTDIAVDAAGNTYVTGTIDSNEQSFPVTAGPDLSYNGPTFDAFVAKVNPQGTGLVYCGYIGGASWDDAFGVAVDANGCAHVVGSTYSTEQTFPVRIGPDLTHNGLVDGFVAKVNPQGTALVYCGYIGGEYRDVGMAIALDTAGEAYVTGWTNSAQSFPVTVGPDLNYNGGGTDAFVAKVSSSGAALRYCGYIGGASREMGYGIAVDHARNAYVTGDTDSTGQSFPVLVGPDLTQNGNDDAFVAKVNRQGTSLVYCGYIGGITLDMGYGIAVDVSGNAYVAGYTLSGPTSFPVAVGPCLTFGGPSGWPGGDAFVAKVNPQGTALVYCGYIGGTAQDEATAIALDASGNAYVTGGSSSDERSFPITAGPDPSHNGSGDAFVAKVSATGMKLIYCGYIGGTGHDTGSGIAVDAVGNAYVAGATGSDERSFPAATGPDPNHNGGYDAFLAKVSLPWLVASGSPRPMGSVTFGLIATGDGGLPYQLGSSLATGPIPIDNRRLDLAVDHLLVASTSGNLPWIFSGYRGTIDSGGKATAALNIPNIPALIGTRIHSAFVTLDAKAPSGIPSISNTETVTIVK